MKLQYTSFALTACLSTAAAMGLSDLPACAKDCATGSIPSHCNSIDAKCICSDKSFISSISCCVASKCSKTEQAGVIKFADQICSGVGVGDLPTSASCASGSTATATSKTESTATGTSMSTTGVGAGAASSTITSAASTATSTGGAALVAQNKDATLYAAMGVAAMAFLA
ncbi:hypothetical protein ASPWEDRAFT_170251 [Aspergillus wentii DTO 134E9]|uniref:CFEM domain-containing protein n=1 Tax=Aspergillus wentii DTO 134E9 TaxID=1073089 RepID=A0A1L9RP85_ASPWE|nr:uncharacterized protein ASPWEDRAFT_170251 [Aspergillus wentii DTO 134E9]KAI9923642.1 hypothetical protein MW887_008462 [Aspergillus wentii]OJJ36741.1 hypothetical protein ASPWEDRAFT_170251 [Aspergillus wentii DTO 134E9]